MDFSDQAPIFEQLFHLARDCSERINLVGVSGVCWHIGRFCQRTRLRSSELTDSGLRYKQSVPIQLRPNERQLLLVARPVFSMTAVDIRGLIRSDMDTKTSRLERVAAIQGTAPITEMLAVAGLRS